MLQEGKGLDCFSETHIVRQDPAPVDLLKIVQPMEPMDLVGPQDRQKMFRRRHLADPVEFPELFVFLLKPDDQLLLITVVIELVDHAHMIFGKPELVAFPFADPEKERIFLYPFLRQHPQCPVMQRHELLPVAQRLLYIRDRYLLIPEDDIHPRIEPVGIAADMDLRLRLGRIEPEILQRVETHIPAPSFPPSHPQKGRTSCS